MPIFLHRGPLLAFCTGQSREHTQSQCVLKTINVEKKTVYNQFEKVNIMHPVTKTFVFLFDQVKHTHSETFTVLQHIQAFNSKNHTEETTGSPVFMFGHELEFLMLTILSSHFFVNQG